MEQLFRPSRPYLVVWTWIDDVQVGGETIITLEERPTRFKATALHYTVLCESSGVANYLIITIRENVNAKSGNHGTLLHTASYKGRYITFSRGRRIQPANSRELPCTRLVTVGIWMQCGSC